MCCVYGCFWWILNITKDANKLISKEMSNIYLKRTIKKNWRSQNFDFLSLKNSSSGQFLGAPTRIDIIKFRNFLPQLKNQRSGNKKVCVSSTVLIFKGIMFWTQRVYGFGWTKTE